MLLTSEVGYAVSGGRFRSLQQLKARLLTLSRDQAHSRLFIECCRL